MKPEPCRIIAPSTLRAFIAFVCIFLISPLSSSAENEPLEFRGSVRISVDQAGTGIPLGTSRGTCTATGSVNSFTMIDVHLREVARNMVLDDSGHLVGEVVVLGNAGSTYTASCGGTMVYTPSTPPPNYGPFILRYGGTAQGSEEKEVCGWVYYSLSDQDPLKQYLPSGSYSLYGYFTKPDAIREVAYQFGKVTGTRDCRFSSSYEIGFYSWLVTGTNPISATEYCNPRWYEPDQPLFFHPKFAGGHHVRDANHMVMKNGRMSGSQSYEFEAGEMYLYTATLSWDVCCTTEQDGVLHKLDDEWRPLGWHEANTTKATAEITSGNSPKGRFRFTLFDVSSEKGYCMNAGDDVRPDLEFVTNQAGFTEPERTDDGQRIMTDSAVGKAEVEIISYDYGAFGKLKAEVYRDGEWVLLTADDGKEYINIPYDDNENGILDLWEEVWGVKGEAASDDYDPEPVGMEEGDGFSNYEEYRGFVVKGQWTDTFPERKDIFIYDSLGWGTGHFHKLGLSINLISGSEFSGVDERVVNFNRGHASAGEQKGLYICSGVLPEYTPGRVEPTVGSPNVVDRVVIDVSKLSGVDQGKIDHILAHELGHAVNIMHHGPHRPEKREVDGGTVEVGLPGQTHSGDCNCVMRYFRAFRYYDPGDGQSYPYPREDTWGNDYCDSRTGTGLNDARATETLDGSPLPMAGDATWGPCRHKVAIKGVHYRGQ